MLYRVVIEMSIMSHNDEHVYYLDVPDETEVSLDEGFIEKAQRHFQDPSVSFHRPVFQEEISEGLDTSYKGNLWDEETPDLTALLDAYFELSKTFSFWSDLKKKQPDIEEIDPAFVVSRYVSNHYYDCMSGGMPKFTMPIIRHLLDCFTDEQLQQPVYPGKIGNYTRKSEDDYTDWYTLEDFKNTCDKEISDGRMETLEDLLQRFRGRLPDLAGIQLLSEKA